MCSKSPSHLLQVDTQILNQTASSIFWLCDLTALSLSLLIY